VVFFAISIFFIDVSGQVATTGTTGSGVQMQAFSAVASTPAPPDMMVSKAITKNGFQNYQCQPDTKNRGKFMWQNEPIAGLYDENCCKIGRYCYNIGPVWGYAMDGIKVKGNNSEDADPPVPNAIKWPIASEKGHEGTSSFFSRVI
jgi:hypothetical protein